MKLSKLLRSSLLLFQPKPPPLMLGEPVGEEEVVFIDFPGIAAACWVQRFERMKREGTPLRKGDS